MQRVVSQRSHKRREFMSFLAFCCAHIKSLFPHFPISGALFPVLRNLFNSHPFQFKFIYWDTIFTEKAAFHSKNIQRSFSRMLMYIHLWLCGNQPWQLKVNNIEDTWISILLRSAFNAGLLPMVWASSFPIIQYTSKCIVVTALFSSRNSEFLSHIFRELILVLEPF